MRPRGTSQWLEERRRRAVVLLAKGLQPVEVAHQLGVDRRSVRRWKAASRTRGEAALKARPAPGRPCRLDAKAQQRLVRLLLKGARAAGFATDLWTCPRVARLIQERFGVRYHVDHLGRLLHGLGFSPQKPQRRALERDEAAIAHWIKHDWPRIKKKPRG